MIRVMVVDDSPLVRKIAADILSADPEIQVVSTAATAEFALQKLKRDNPDVITMDMEMPGMGGLAAIREIMRLRPTPIIVMSAHARRGADLTLQALDAGAVELVLKPTQSLSGGLDAVARELIEKVKSARSFHLATVSPEAEVAPPLGPSFPEAASVPMRAGSGRYDLVAIGTSTGGPVALKAVLERLPRDFRLPILVVQHMPPVFTRAFAERLHSICALEVKEAEDGDPIKPGRALIAPGDFHLSVSRAGGEPMVALSQTEPVSGHRPSVDVLMHSVASTYGQRAIGVIMTGMGRDGASGMGRLHETGGYIIAQDAETSVIYGMNREVISRGDAHEVRPVQEIAAALVRLSQETGLGNER